MFKVSSGELIGTYSTKMKRWVLRAARVMSSQRVLDEA
jgi:hypothetical protein